MTLTATAPDTPTAPDSPERVDLFSSTYSHFSDTVVRAVRLETFGEDIGQNSWVTVDEFDRFAAWLNVCAGSRVLEIASGSGGPALRLAESYGCDVTGIDENAEAIATATRLAAVSKRPSSLRFVAGDVTRPLPFEAAAFDALVCIDSMNHFPNRQAVFEEWYRVLRPGGRAVFTDPVVVTGLVTNDELAARSAIGLFVFAPPGVNEALIEAAGLRLMCALDVTANAAQVAGRWHAAREAHRAELLAIEGRARYQGLQRFFAAVHRLTRERRLSRIAYLVEKPTIGG